MKWIKCSDKLPTPDIKINTHAFTKVLVWGGVANGDTAMFYEHKGFSTTMFDSLFEDHDIAETFLERWKDGITHWMEIEPPEDYMKPKSGSMKSKVG